MSEKKPKPVKEKKAKKPPKGAAMKSEAGEEGEEAAPAKKKMAGKTLILFVLAPLVLLGGGGAAAFLLLAPKDKPAHEAADSHGAGAEALEDGGHGEAKDAHGKKDKKGDKKKGKDSHGKPAKEGKGGHGGVEATAATIREGDGVYYYTLPDILVNIGGGDGKSAYLKLKLTVEATTEDPLRGIEPELPRVLDLFQAFLRELRIDDLNGSTGSYRLRVELLRRLNLAIAPAEAEAVLIEEMLIQ